MTDFLLCVLIATVAYGIDILSRTAPAKVEREAVGLVMIVGLVMGGVLYGLVKLAGWLIGKYGTGLL